MDFARLAWSLCKVGAGFLISWDHMNGAEDLRVLYSWFCLKSGSRNRMLFGVDSYPDFSSDPNDHVTYYQRFSFANISNSKQVKEGYII